MSANPASFGLKQLRATFQLSGGATFQGTNSNTLQIAGLRMSAAVKYGGGSAVPQCTLKVYGMLQTDMNALIAVSLNVDSLTRNTLVLEANSDDGAGWITLFTGQIFVAGPSYEAAPDVCLIVQASTAYWFRLVPAQPSSSKGNVSVAQLANTYANAMGMTLENNSVTATLNNPYFPGTTGQQLQALCQHSNTDLYLENSIVAICPSNQPRNLMTPVLSPESGLIGTPTRDNVSVYGQALFSPAIRFGGPVTINSPNQFSPSQSAAGLPASNGTWRVAAVYHLLDALVPRGNWFTQFQAAPFGVVVAPQ